MNMGYINQSELAKQLGVAESTINRLRKYNGLPFYTIGRNIRFNIKEVNEWLANRHGNKPEPTPGPTTGYKTDNDAHKRLVPETPPEEDAPPTAEEMYKREYEAMKDAYDELHERHTLLYQQYQQVVNLLSEMHRILGELLNGQQNPE